MPDLEIITSISKAGSGLEKSMEKLDLEEPYGVIRDVTYSGDYLLVRWPEEADDA